MVRNKGELAPEGRKYEYKEGPEARENFEKALTKIFRAPKKTGSNPVKATGRKKRGKKQG
jgi:hypothetical protein